MTTILADAKAGVMAADSAVSDGDRVWTARKVHRVRGALVGLSGLMAHARPFLEWLRAGADFDPEFDFGESSALVLRADGLWLFDSEDTRLQRVRSGREAVGTGAAPALAAYEAMGWSDPRRAVRIACRHDINSRAPVRLYRL